jgi:hypothetical protein
VSPPAYTTVPLISVLGLVGAVAVAVPVLGWWSKIRARRKEEEKRVTL